MMSERDGLLSGLVDEEDLDDDIEFAPACLCDLERSLLDCWTRSVGKRGRVHQQRSGVGYVSCSLNVTFLMK